MLSTAAEPKAREEEWTSMICCLGDGDAVAEVDVGGWARGQRRDSSPIDAN